MSYLIFTDITEAEAYQSQVDTELGYPEPLDSLHYIGGGIHAPLELGRAMHYAEIDTDQTGTQFALPRRGETAAPCTATLVDGLPDGWHPSIDMI
jgi:hypothetical protein